MARVVSFQIKDGRTRRTEKTIPIFALKINNIRTNLQLGAKIQMSTLLKSTENVISIFISAQKKALCYLQDRFDFHRGQKVRYMT